MGKGKKLIFDAGLVFFIGLLASVLGYLIRVVLSRKLTLEEFGLFYAVFTFVSFFSVFRDLGLSMSLPKFIPQFLVKKEYSKISSSIKFIFLANFFISSFISIILLIFADFLSVNYFRNELAKPLLIIFGFYFVLHSIYNVFVAIFIGFQKSKFYSLDLFLINLFVFAGIFIFSRLNIFSPAIYYLIATFLGIIIYSIFLFKSFNITKYKEKISKSLKLDLLKYGFPLMLALVGYIVIAQIDTLILTYFRSIEEVGIYNVILPTSMLLITLGSSLALVMMPLISESWAAKRFSEVKNLIKNIYQKIFILIVPAGFILLVFSDFILNILFGTNFIVGSFALKILAIGGIFFSFAIINNNILAATGNPKKISKIILTAAIINLVLNIILIPIYGINGAAWATTISYLFVLVLSTYFVTRIIKIVVPLFDWIKIFFSGVIFILVTDFLREIFVMNIWLEIFVVLLIGATVYFGLLRIFGIKLDFLNRKTY